GTRLVPADFIAVANPAHPLRDGETDVHELFLANFFAQTKALAFGKTAEEVRAEGTREDLVSARVFEGNRPTTSILAPALTPSVLGQLIALYEHITFVQGVVWGIDSFDQWGVELGKKLANEITPAITGDTAVLDAQDPSTRLLIETYHTHRTSPRPEAPPRPPRYPPAHPPRQAPRSQPAHPPQQPPRSQPAHPAPARTPTRPHRTTSCGTNHPLVE